MAGIARANIDFAITHIPLSGGAPHIAPSMTKYIPGGAKVFVNGQAAIVLNDSTACGDTVIETSTKVFVGGKGVHRLGDKLTAHMGTYSPSICAQASTDVFAG